MKTMLLCFGLLFLFAAEILRVYFIMPFPGSQQGDNIGIAYWLHQNINWLRTVALLMIAYPAYFIFKKHKLWTKIALGAVLLFYAVIFFMFNFRFQADKMFYQPTTKVMAKANANKVALNKLVVGLSINNEAKAYPVQLIGYHHQVRDTVGGLPVMITYCTVCRTGRVYSPQVNGHTETFRLVGMDHFNAMFEDSRTGSWWRQATGEAVAGPLKGKQLKELPAQQMTLAAWLEQYPTSAVMQPDTIYKKDYEELALFDNGTIKSSLERRDSASWAKKSWVVGVRHNNFSKAYDWNDLQQAGLIQDSLPDLPIVLTIGKDSTSFFVRSRKIEGATLRFEANVYGKTMQDLNTGSVWTPDGRCIAGSLNGTRLEPVQAYQEFWHSWQQFQPQTARFTYNKRL